MPQLDHGCHWAARLASARITTGARRTALPSCQCREVELCTLGWMASGMGKGRAGAAAVAGGREQPRSGPDCSVGSDIGPGQQTRRTGVSCVSASLFSTSHTSRRSRSTPFRRVAVRVMGLESTGAGSRSSCRHTCSLLQPLPLDRAGVQLVTFGSRRAERSSRRRTSCRCVARSSLPPGAQAFLAHLSSAREPALLVSEIQQGGVAVYYGHNALVLPGVYRRIMPALCHTGWRSGSSACQ